MSSEANPYELKRQQLPKKKKEKKAATSHEPSRHSARLHPNAAEVPQETSELALCIVNGKCPRCGKYVDVGHKKHLEHCSSSKKRKQADSSGHVEIEGLDELEAEEEEQLHSSSEADAKPAKKSKPSKSQAEKLKELELSGLVDFDQQHARFVVIGSTGSHYSVELKDPAPSCQCVDFRIRRRICKHQKLVLAQLGIPDAPQDWHKAVESKLDELAQGEPADRQSRLGETEYDPDYEEELQAEPSQATKRQQSARSVARSNASKQHQAEASADAADDNGSDDGDGGGSKTGSKFKEQDSDDGGSQQEGTGEKGGKQKAGAGDRSAGSLSPAGLAWPKRPPKTV